MAPVAPTLIRSLTMLTRERGPSSRLAPAIGLSTEKRGLQHLGRDAGLDLDRRGHDAHDHPRERERRDEAQGLPAGVDHDPPARGRA